MNVLNNKKSSYVRTNGHNLWINVVAQKLLYNPDFVDIELDPESKLITIRENNEAGAFKVTHVRDGQCKISIGFLISHSIFLQDKHRFPVQGNNGIIKFSYK